MGFEDFISYRGVYSIIGAASLTGSVTRTVSVAVIVLELNGHLSHVVPVLIGVLVSYITSELLNPQGFFEMLSELRGFNKQLEKKGNITARAVLEKENRYGKINFISEDMTVEQVKAVTQAYLEEKSPGIFQGE